MEFPRDMSRLCGHNLTGASRPSNNLFGFVLCVDDETSLGRYTERTAVYDAECRR